MLDDPSSVSRMDRRDLLSQLAGLPEQLLKGKELTKGLGSMPKPESLIIQGMGGSGIVGDIVRDWLSPLVPIPISTNKDSALHPLVDRRTLLILISYSGNTMETLEAFKVGIKRTGDVVCIGSGGRLLETARKKGVGTIAVPGGLQPRCALGHMLGASVRVLRKAGIHDGERELASSAAHLKGLRAKLMPGTATRANPAKGLALELKDKIPIICAHQGIASCATRWQTALNENAKVLSWTNTTPEMMHNEVEGLGSDDRSEDFALVFLEEGGEPAQVAKAMEFLEKRTKARVVRVKAGGKGKLERMLHLIYLGDFVSYYLAALRGVDPMPVRVIEGLKKATD